MRSIDMPEEATTTLTEYCETEVQIPETEEKLDEHARDIIQSLAQRFYDQRKQTGGQDDHSEEELRNEDWFRAQAVFCAALQDRVQRLQDLPAGDEPPQDG